MEVFTIVGQLVPGSDLLLCSQWLIVVGYYNDGSTPMYIEGAGGLSLGWSTGRDGDSFRHNMYMLYLSSEDAILTILCLGLPITIMIASEWLKTI